MTAPSPRRGSAARPRWWRPPTGSWPTPTRRRASSIELYDADRRGSRRSARGGSVGVPARVAPAARAPRLGLPADAVVLLFAGRIQPLKGPDVVLHAAAELLRPRPALAGRLVVVFVGGPSGLRSARPGRLDGAGRPARHRRRGADGAAVPAARAGRLVPGRDGGARAVVLGIVRAGGPGGAGLRHARGRRRGRRAADRGPATATPASWWTGHDPAGYARVLERADRLAAAAGAAVARARCAHASGFGWSETGGPAASGCIPGPWTRPG